MATPTKIATIDEVIATQELATLFKNKNHVVYISLYQIQTLLDLGADVNNAGNTDPGARPLYQAACYGIPEQVHYLLSRGADVSLDRVLLSDVCVYQERRYALEVVQALVQNGANVRNDVRPLICAVQHNTPAVVKYLLDQGANPFAKSIVVNTGIGVAFRPGKTGDALTTAKNRLLSVSEEEKQYVIALVKDAQERFRQRR